MLKEKKLVSIKPNVDAMYKVIGTELKSGDAIKTEKGKVLTIISNIDKGKRGKVFKVRDEYGKEFALKVAINQTPETIESMNKEVTKASFYEKYKIPHAKVIESNSLYALKDLIAGVRADEWVKGWEAKGFPKETPEVQGLQKLIDSISKNGVYVGDLNRKNLIWDGVSWVVIDSGEISEGLSAQESLDKFLEKIPSRLSKNDNGERCQILYKKLVKTLRP
jgi:hypothetical protein